MLFFLRCLAAARRLLGEWEDFQMYPRPWSGGDRTTTRMAAACWRRGAAKFLAADAVRGRGGAAGWSCIPEPAFAAL